jgi:D-amino peptidase
MTSDVNACVGGCFAGGATKVVVRDAHGAAGGQNLIWDEVDARADYIQGVPAKERMPGIGAFDGLILLGYHAMAGTPLAVLEHTMSSKAWQDLWMNGKKSGEIAIDAGIAGDHGVPTIMVTGDDKACREARRFIKGVVTAQVKEGLGVEGAKLLPRERAHGRISEGAAKAVRSCSEIRPFRMKAPVRIRLELVSRGRVPVGRPGVKVIDGRTYEVSAPSVEEALRMLG